MTNTNEIESTTRAGQQRVDETLAYLRSHPDALRQFFADVRANLKRQGDQLRRETKSVPPSAQTQRILELVALCTQLHANWLASQR